MLPSNHTVLIFFQKYFTFFFENGIDQADQNSPYFIDTVNPFIY